VDPISVQIAGADPAMMAEAARYNVAQGAQIIDINMGCPAKKICNVMAGSALLQDQPLVGRILDAVVGAVNVPVTLKIRTGWDTQHRNALAVASIAESAGVQALAIHGRTRACAYAGHAEYDTIAEVKAAVKIPVIANGDITTPEQARRVLEYTRADAVMIGRASLWGLAANGEDGVGNVLDVLRSGIDSALRGMGVSSTHELTADHLYVPDGFHRALGTGRQP
jgi:tRNA-dihydrouridine synthase B